MAPGVAAIYSRREDALVTAEQLEEFALSLPEAYETPHFGRRSFRIGKKIFATMTADGREAMVTVKPPDKLETLLAAMPDVFFSYGGWTTRNGSLGVRVAKVKVELMRDLVLDSYRRVAPRRCLTALDGDHAPGK